METKKFMNNNFLNKLAIKKSDNDFGYALFTNSNYILIITRVKKKKKRPTEFLHFKCSLCHLFRFYLLCFGMRREERRMR